MSKFIITGGKPLKGEITVSGSKNATLALMAASLLTSEECVFSNVPNIGDVKTMSQILTELGAKVVFENHRLSIKADHIKSTNPASKLVSKLRGSILLLGPLLGRFREVSMSYPGGDLIGKRPVDVHIAALTALGAQAQTDGLLRLWAKQLKGKKIVLEESSVTATENAMMAAVLAEGKTVIKLAAMEPHVQQLADFLNKMGAKIKGAGSTTIEVEGQLKLNGAEIEIIPDSDEAASLITLASATKSDMKIRRLNPDYLEDFFVRMFKMNVSYEVEPDYVHVKQPKSDYLATKIQSGLYPKLNSDYVPPMAVLATQAKGESLIYEWLYENRLGYVPQLKKMGANIEVLDPHQVRIVGPTPLYGQKITSYDLRMGMTLVIAGLLAEGTTEISGIEHIDRGYESLEQRLAKLGADIKRID